MNLVVLATFTMTLPCQSQMPEGCDASGQPVGALGQLILYAQSPGEPERTVASWSVAGWECMPVTVSNPFVLSGDSVWVRTTDAAGNLSCASPRVQYVQPSTPTPEPAPIPVLPVEYFDIAGRRLPERPRTPGWYVVRVGGVTRPFVVWR